MENEPDVGIPSSLKKGTTPILSHVPKMGFLNFKINETPIFGHAQTPKNAGFGPKMSHFSAR
jgi:ribosomal protein L15